MSFPDIVVSVPGDTAPVGGAKYNAFKNACIALAPQEIALGITPVNPQVPFLNAVRYGVDMTGATDSTAAMTIAHSMGLPICYPAGTVKFSNISMTDGGIIGAGRGATSFITTDVTSDDCITVTGTNASPTFRDFNISPSGTRSGGYAITLAGNGSNMVLGAMMYRVLFTGFVNCVNHKQAYECSFIACQFQTFTGIGLNVDNQAHGDYGDSAVIDCMFGATSTATSIYQVASGGLRILSSKFIGGNIHYQLNLGGSTNTSDLFINNCSFEQCVYASIVLGRQSGATATFNNINIAGNQFVAPNGASYYIYSNNGSQWLANSNLISITDNLMGGAAASAIYLDWINYGPVSLVNNNINGVGTPTGPGIYLGANFVNALTTKVGLNSIQGYATPIVANAALQSPGNFADNEVTATLATSQNNYAPTGFSDGTMGMFLTAASGGSTITGLAAPTNRGSVQVTLFNMSANSITLSHQSGSSSAANQFNCPGATNYVIPAYGIAVLYYSGYASGNQQKWFVK